MKPILVLGALAALVIVWIPIDAKAQEAPAKGALQQFLTDQSPQCVPVADIAKVAQTIDLKESQFQFLRAVFVATPPQSKTLPPGDRAILAADETGEIMAAIVDDGEACARFMLPPVLQAMLAEVNKKPKHRSPPA